jgi:Rod binding domain-containing protein
LAISPPGDIVLDVMRAAEPDKVQAAREQLQRIAQGAAPSASFSAALSSAPGAKVEKSETPYQQFEAMVLGTFLQSMLPEGTESVYGEGMSGDMWKSLLAQELGDAVAARGGIGIANRLLADHYREGDRKVALSGVPGGPVQAALDDQNRLSRALVQELQRKAAQPLIDSAVGAREPSAE